MYKRGSFHLFLAALLAVTLAACQQHQAQQKAEQSTAAESTTAKTPPTATPQLRLASFGGSFQETLDHSLVQPIAKKLGVRAVVETYGGEYDRLAATIKNGSNTYDLVHVETRFLIQGGRQGLLTPIDWQVVDKDAFVEGATNKFGVGLLSWSLVLSWNRDRLPPGTPPPSTWRDFFDTTRYPGPRALRNTPEGNLEIALLADGVLPAELYKNGLDVKRALAKLSTIKESITWWGSGAELEQKLTSSAALAAAWNGRVAHLKHATKAPVGWSYDGSVNQFDWWVIPANAPHKELAMKFLAATAAGTGQLAIAKSFGYGPVAKTALKAMDPALRSETPSAPENARLGVTFDGAWWASHTTEVTAEWNQWRLGK